MRASLPTRRGRWALLLAAVSTALVVTAAGPALRLPSSGLAAQEALADPPMPEAPKRLRVDLAVGGFDWDEDEALPEVEGVVIWGAELETLVHPLLSFRLGVGYGRPEIRSDQDRLSADQYMVELLANLRAPLGAMGEAGVVPFLTGGYGSVVHVPRDRDDLITKNQSAYVFGAGVEYDALADVGFRAEWRRTRVEFIDVFEPEDRDAVMRDVDRWVLGAYWKF
ncbi:MAG: outer membrane beta-barrel protein [Gemmatimonadota bacterium]|jgi:opacity protein-like surface antigen